MIDISRAGTFALGTRRVKRVGYGAMQLAGPGVFGPPKDRQSALAVLREALASGVDHIDTSDYYGPHVTNHLIREALHPYPDNLVLVTKIGARRGADGSWNPAFSAEHLTSAVHDNLRHLKIDALDVVNLRLMFSAQGPAEGSIEAPLAVLAGLQRQGLVRHIGLSNVTRKQVEEGRAIAILSVCRTITILPIEKTTRSSMNLPAPRLPMCPSSRSAVSRRCSQPRSRRPPRRSARRQCRWRSPGCFSAHPTFC